MGWQSLTDSMAPKILLGKGGSKEVREFSQVEDFGRDIKIGQDASSTPTTTGTGAATVGSPPPKQRPNSDNPTTEGRPHYLQQPNYQQHQPTPQPSTPYSPRSILTPPYEPYYSNNLVDDSSNRHIIIHNDDPSERPTTSNVASTALPPLPLCDQRRLPPFDPRWHTIKRVLTLLSMTWSIVILVLSCLFAVHGGLADGVGLWSLPITIAALLWNTAELLTYCVRSHLGSAESVRRGMHPGAHVGGHLCFWLTCALAIYLSSSVYSDVLDTRRDCNSVAAAVAAADGSVTVESADFEVLLRGHCNSNYHFASNLGLYREGFYVPGLQALLAMFVMATVTHFALFVRACVEVDQRNQLRFSREDDLADETAGARAWPGQWDQYYRRSMRKSKSNHGMGRSRGGAPEMAQQYV